MSEKKKQNSSSSTNSSFLSRVITHIGQNYTRYSAIAIVLSIAAVYIVLSKYKVQLKAYSLDKVESYGFPALFMFTMLMDLLIQPIPPDVLVLAAAAFGMDWHVTAGVAALGSACGGLGGSYIGRAIGPWRFRALFGSKLLKAGRDLYRKRAALAIFISGVSPIPYSAACWVGGMYRMNKVELFASSLVSRFLRYVIIAYIGKIAFAASS